MTRELDENFKIAFDLISDPFFFTNDKQEIFFANQACKVFLKEKCGLNQDTYQLKNFWPDAKFDKNILVLETHFLSPQGSFPVKLSLNLLDGGIYMIGVSNQSSTSELIQSLHSQRINTLGMLAGGVAHDFNNILTGLLGHITYLKNILPGTGNHQVSLSALEEGARKASLLTSEILNFSRQDSSERPNRVDLVDIIRRTFTLLRGAISPEYELNCHLPEKSVPILGSESKVSQVVVNLVMNARDAISVGGKIDIVLDFVTNLKEVQQAFASEELSSKRWARLSVIDNGEGIPEDVMHRIFEPYFSTKREKGNGLGLAIVNEIVKMFAGAIRFKSQMGTGTHVSIYLPILEDESASIKDKNKNRTERIPGGNERILVVDDEHPVRNVLSLSLEHLGYAVQIASSGQEALHLFQHAKGQYDLVILDMLMPNLSGDQTFFKLKEIDPNVRVLVISGFASQEAVDSILDNGGLGFVQKPFTITELAKRVRECFNNNI